MTTGGVRVIEMTTEIVRVIEKNRRGYVDEIKQYW